MNNMSSTELNYWIAYDSISPIDDESESVRMKNDHRAGVVAATIANANRDPKKRPRPFKPQDFMPKYSDSRKSTRRDSGKVMKVKVDILRNMFGKRR